MCSIVLQHIRDRLHTHILSREQLKENGFPFDSKFSCGGNNTDGRNDAMLRSCSRCKNKYTDSGENECIFHPGKLFDCNNSRIYTCCNKIFLSKGCKSSNCHVNSLIVCDLPFVKTVKNKLSSSPLTKAYALDTEMCYTTEGLEVTRITLVSLHGTSVFEVFILPKNPIIDYNTSFSGVTAKKLQGITWTLEDVQKTLLKIIHSDTILIGHALHNDLHALGLVHSCVVDTSIMFPHKQGPPKKNSLKMLASTVLHKTIQNSPNGHDSFEDATTCIELVQHKILSDAAVCMKNYKLPIQYVTFSFNTCSQKSVQYTAFSPYTENLRTF